MSKNFYFISYTKSIQGLDHFCNDTIREHPVKWIMKKCKENPSISYNLVFYNEISIKEYIIFHPELKESCDNCPERKNPAWKHCQHCIMKIFRKDE